MNQEAVMKNLIKFDDIFNNQASNLLETIFNEPVKVTIDDTKLFDLEEVKSFIGQQALRVDIIIPEKNNGFVYLASDTLLPELSKYLKSEGKNSPKVPDSMQLLLDVAEQISMIKKKCFEEVLHNQVEFNSPSILEWNGKVEQAFNESIISFYSIKIGTETNFSFLRIIPSVIASSYFEQIDLDNDNVNAQTEDFEEFTDSPANVDAQQSIDFIHDLELLVTVELGRISMALKDMLALGPGSIVELNKFAGEPVEVYVNNKKFAEGEVVVVDQNFAVRITSLIAKQDRLASLSS